MIGTPSSSWEGYSQILECFFTSLMKAIGSIHRKIDNWFLLINKKPRSNWVSIYSSNIRSNLKMWSFTHNEKRASMRWSVFLHKSRTRRLNLFLLSLAYQEHLQTEWRGTGREYPLAWMSVCQLNVWLCIIVNDYTVGDYINTLFDPWIEKSGSDSNLV